MAGRNEYRGENKASNRDPRTANPVEELDHQGTRAWHLRRKDGELFTCAGPEMLRQWIVEGRVSRSDQVSAGGPWYTLGDSKALAPFFAARDKAAYAEQVAAQAQARSPKPPPLPPSRGSAMKSMPSKAARPPSALIAAPTQKPIASQNRRLLRKTGLSGEFGLTPARNDEESEALVRSFTWKRRIRGVVLTAVGATLLLGTAGLIYAMAGPQDNPARKYIEEHGLVPGLAAANEAADQAASSAHARYERGDISDLRRADASLEKALAVRRNDPELKADRALVLTAYAAALMRAQSATGAAQPDQTRATAAGTAPAQPSELLRTASALALDAEAAAPSALPTLRALAEYYRVTNDEPRRAQYLERAKAAQASTHVDDPWLMAIEAASIAGDHPDRAKAEHAASLLERAVASRPMFSRARIQLAQLYMIDQAYDRAEAELAVVLKNDPAYQEAARLLTEVRALRPSAPPAGGAPQDTAQPPPGPNENPSASPSGDSTPARASDEVPETMLG